MLERSKDNHTYFISPTFFRNFRLYFRIAHFIEMTDDKFNNIKKYILYFKIQHTNIITDVYAPHTCYALAGA